MQLLQRDIGKTIPSPLNNTGGKYKLLPQILPLVYNQHGYSFYHCGSDNGFVGYNRAGFLSLRNEFNKRIDGMKIIPIETKELKAIVAKEITYKELYRMFAHAHESRLLPHEWYGACIRTLLE